MQNDVKSCELKSGPTFNGAHFEVSAQHFSGRSFLGHLLSFNNWIVEHNYFTYLRRRSERSEINQVF
jgi:hypothetical protein